MAQHYDVALIGGDVSQLVAALMLARRGRRVVVVEHEAACAVDAALPLSPVGEMSCLARYHDELGITPPPTMRPKDRVAWQVILPNHRLSLASDRGGVAHELKRAFPKDARAIDDLLQELNLEHRAICTFLQGAPSLPPESWWEQFNLWRATKALAMPLMQSAQQQQTTRFASLPGDHPLQRLMSHGLPLMQYSCTQPLSRFAAVHLMAQALMGHPADAANKADLLQLLWGAAQRAGIDIRRGAGIKHMVPTGKRITHLELQDGSQQLRAECYVYGGRSPLSQWCQGPAAARAQRLEDDAYQALQQQAGSLLQRQWQVPVRLLNQALGPRVWHVDGRIEGRDGAPADEPFVLQRQDQADTATLTVTAPVQHPVPPGRVDAEPCLPDHVTHEGWAQATWQRIEPRLRRTLPHLPADGAGLGPMVQGAHRRPQLGPASYLGVTGRSRSSSLSNVVCCSRDVVPGLGLEGEYLAAAGSVALISRRAGWR